MKTEGPTGASLRLQAANAWFRGLRLGAALPLLLALVVHAGPGLNTDSPFGFFTNLAARMLQVELNRELTHIQVYPTNQYTPAVHRLLQVTANLYDATTNRYNLSPPYLPSVFRPIFRRQGNAVFISGYEEVNSTTGWSDPVFALPLNLSDPAARNSLPDGADSAVNVYGVPWIIGARKGFPNFNEFAMSSTFAMARKLEIERASTTQRGMNGTLRMKYVLNLTNVLGIELWNSYTSSFLRDLEVAVQLDVAMVLTNDDGMAPHEFHTPVPFARVFAIPADSWSGYNSSTTNSFFIPLLTNVPFLPESTYLMGTKTLSQSPNLGFENGQGFPYPQWGFSSTNRLRAIIRDTATGRIVDYVQLNSLNGRRNLSEEIRTGGYDVGPTDPNKTRWREGMWNTNRTGDILIPYGGITNQLLASIGSYGVDPPTASWADFGRFDVRVGSSVRAEIEAFRLFYLGLPGNTNLITQVPFTPIARYRQHLAWQANDPLVHYLTRDISSPDWSNGVGFVSVKLPLPRPNNIGYLNNRLRPWGGNPNLSPTDPDAFNHALKDPLVDSSDRWDFPNNEPLSLPMVRHVHRGTPWQTIYLKAEPIQSTTWRNWTGNSDLNDAQRTQPIGDWQLVALINSLINTNDPRRLISVNEGNTNIMLSALDGIVALTNSVAEGEPVIMTSNSPQAAIVAEAIRVARANQPNQRFTNLESLLAIPELSVASPWLNQTSPTVLQRGTSDEAYETVAAQLLERLRPDSVGFISQTNGVMKVQFTGFNDYPYAVESSSNLVNWLPVTTNSPTNGVLEFFPPAPGLGQQFYRSTLIP